MAAEAQALKILPENERYFGRYMLLYRFASGGMANVYLGRFKGPDGFEKLVAIKRIHEHLTQNRDFVKMFTDEARLAARITHPNIVQVMELGVTQGYHFIAMEYVDGESLSAFVRNTSLPLPMSARIIADAASGLHSAHELCDVDGSLLHVVHRDVSPQNILISYQGAVKVADFGVARAKSNVHVTSVGTVKGKFSYMAPEQADSQPVDRRTDLFSLGIVLYEITTRHRLFKGANSSETVDKVLLTKVVPPSRLVNEYPETLEKIVLKALQRNPDDRYQTGEEFQKDLEEYIFSTGILITQTTISNLVQKVFAQRIEHKRQLMLQCKDIADSVPEVDLRGAEHSLSGPVASQVERAVRKRRRGIVFSIVAGVFLAIGIFIFMMLRDNSMSNSSVVRILTGAGSKFSTGTRVGKNIEIEIETQPSNAKILFDGNFVDSPYRVFRKKHKGNALVVVSASGYREHRFNVDLSKGGSWVVALSKEVSSEALDAGFSSSLDDSSQGGAAGPNELLKPFPWKTKTSKRAYWPKSKKNDDDLFGNPYK